MNVDLNEIPPSPGSSDALNLGCRCAVMDNNYGKGMVIGDSVLYWVHSSCKLHGKDYSFKPFS